MATKPISIRLLEDRFVCGCAEEHDRDDAPVRIDGPRAGSFRLRAADPPRERRTPRRGRIRSTG